MLYLVGHRLKASTASPIPKDAGPASDWLTVGQDDKGRWIVRDKLGLKGGIFTTLKAALRFANKEAAAAGCAVTLAAGLIESGL